MRAILKSLNLDPDPSTLPDDPSEFVLLARMIVGPRDMPGEESFDVTVCTPEWLAKTCREVGGIHNARHHLVVNLDDFDVRKLRAWLAARVQDVEADTWSEIAERLGRLGYWEFEDYRSNVPNQPRSPTQQSRTVTQANNRAAPVGPVGGDPNASPSRPLASYS